MTIFSANLVKFDKDYLEELTSLTDSGVLKQECQYHVALHPAQINDFGQSIKSELTRKIARYDDKFKGIMLGYDKIRLVSKHGAIGLDNIYIHFDIQANFYVFQPVIGMILKGTVTRTTIDHVGCLVYKTFNISIPKPADDDGSWLGQKVATKTEVEFIITFVDLHARLPHIRGQIRSILSAEEPNMDKKKKRNMKIKFTSKSEEVEEGTNPSIANEETPKKSKKKKKSKEPEVKMELDSEPEQEARVQKSKKKSKKIKEKRSKKIKEDEISLEDLDLKSLFSNTSMDMNETSTTAADSQDKKTKRKRSKSMSQDALIDKVKLEMDSSLERIINS